MTTYDWGKFGFHIPEIMLPREGTDYGKWAVVACDQYTSEPGYWEDAERIVGDALNQQSSSQKRINKLSNDPVDMSRIQIGRAHV